MLSGLLDRLEARYGRHKGIRNLMNIVVIGTICVFMMDYLLPVFTQGTTMSSLLSFNKSRIMKGEIWRVITFIFVPESSANLIMMAIGLYFDWLMGDMLQSHWGTLRFTIFYTAGMLGAVIGGCITGYATAYYLNMSLMLAMACIYPDMQLRLYGMINLKLKWLALLSLLMMVLPMISAMRYIGWQQPLAMALSLINVLIFFADRLLERFRTMRRHQQWKKNWRDSWKR